MMFKFLAAIVFLVAVPRVNVQWGGAEEADLKVMLSGQKEFVEQCLESGLEVQYRFELQLCKRRLAWFDACKEVKLLVHKLRLDRVSEQYQLESDLHGDTAQPERSNVDSFDEALVELSQLNGIPIMILAEEDSSFVSSRRTYVSTRVRSSCKGEYNKTLARISYFLTLGLVDVMGFDSGWDDYYLQERSAGLRGR